MLLDELTKLITDNATEFVLQTSIFKGIENAACQDTCTFVHETGGLSPDFVFNSSNPVWEQPSVQIINRSTNYQTARNNAQTIYNLLQQQANVTLAPNTSAGASGALYYEILPLQSPFLLGLDANQRIEISCNYSIRKTLST